MDPLNETQLAETWRQRLSEATGLNLETVTTSGFGPSRQVNVPSGTVLPDALVEASLKAPCQARFLMRNSRLFVAVAVSPNLLIAGSEAFGNSNECAAAAKLFSVSVQGIVATDRCDHEQAEKQMLAGHAAELYEQFHTLMALGRMLSVHSSIEDTSAILMDSLPYSLPTDHAFLVEQPDGNSDLPRVIASSRRPPLSLLDDLPALVERIVGCQQPLVFLERNPGTEGNGGFLIAAEIRPQDCRPCWLIAVRNSPGTSFGSEAGLFLTTVAGLLERHIENVRLYAEKDRMQLAFVRSLVKILDARDQDTRGHSERVAALARILGRQLGCSVRQQEQLGIAGLLHDLGKIGVPDETLLKTAPLDQTDWKRIRMHPELGEAMLREIIEDETIRAGIRHHHERWDGRGYPDGLAGDAIPLAGRILAVADSLDAMASRRHYRENIASREIDIIFLEGAGRQWDPDIVAAYFACRDELYRVRSEMLMDTLLPDLSESEGETKGEETYPCQFFKLEETAAQSSR